MKIPPFWKSHQKDDIVAWGWSFKNIEEAARDAEARLERILAYLHSGKTLRHEYEYLDRPMREEIIDRVHQNGSEIAILTRNRYGALVLNSADVCFVDIDFAEPKRQPVGFWEGLAQMFAKKKPQPAQDPYANAETAAIERVKTWARSNDGRSYRLYRTAAGLRMMMTDKIYDPVAPETDRLFEQLGSDPCYRRLTKRQECFRARLTPKPWRLRVGQPYTRYPRENGQEKRFRDWLARYEAKSAAFATCRLIETIGETPADSHIGEIIALHDKYACDGNGKQLGLTMIRPIRPIWPIFISLQSHARLSNDGRLGWACA